MHRQEQLLEVVRVVQADPEALGHGLWIEVHGDLGPVPVQHLQAVVGFLP
jgi:hypothetical protein